MFNGEEDNFRRKWEDEYEFKVWSLWNMDHVAVIYSKSQLQPNRKINKLINCIVKLPRGLNIIFIWTKFSYKIGCSLNL